MGKKGSKSTSKQPENDWGETKSAVFSVGLTPTGKRLVDEQCQKYGISRGELLERYVRGAIDIPQMSPEDTALLGQANRSPPAQAEIIKAINHSCTLKEAGQIARVAINRLEQGVDVPSEPELDDVNQGELAIAFLRKLVSRTATDGDAIEVADILDIDTAILSQAIRSIKGGRKASNGV